MIDFLIFCIGVFFIGMALERTCKGVYYLYEANKIEQEIEKQEIIDEPAEVIDEPKSTKKKIDEIFSGVEVDYSGRFYE